MIGLFRPNHVPDNADEPPACRGKSKHQLHAMLAEEWCLPSPDSKGSNRQFLVNFYQGNCYRVRALDMKRFEVELSPAQQKKTGLVNLAYIYRKLNALLQERGELGLGFPENVIPEEASLTRIARYVDRKNVMEYFQQSLEPLGVPQLPSENVHLARMEAHKFIFDNNQLLNHPKVYGSVKEISDTYRKIISKKIDIEDINRTRLDLIGRLNDDEAQLKASLMKASTTIVAAAQDNFDPDEIYIDEQGAGARHQLRDITDL